MLHINLVIVSIANFDEKERKKTVIDQDGNFIKMELDSSMPTYPFKLIQQQYYLIPMFDFLNTAGFSKAEQKKVNV